MMGDMHPRLLLLLSAALLWGGCSIRPPRYHHVTTPQAEVQSVAVTQVTQEGARVEVTVELHNPNDMALPLRVSRYTLRIESIGEMRLTDLPPVTIPARGSRRVVLPTAIATDGHPLQGHAYSFEGTVTYEPPGEIRKVMTESGVPLPSAAFRGQGTLQ
jgi:LEA14-like dessication related protein